MKYFFLTALFRFVKIVWAWLIPFDSPITAQRARFEKLGGKTSEKMQRKFPDIHESIVSIAGLRVLRLQPRDPKGGLLLYLHGGAFCLGSIDSYRESAYSIAEKLQRELWLPEYRLGPEHVFPAALDDATACYRQAVESFKADNIILIGDSAGGGLTLKLIERLRELGEKTPSKAVVFSPWTDLTQSGESHQSRRKLDIFLSKESLDHYAGMAAGRDPRVLKNASALFGSGPGETSLLVICGENEVLLDDTLRYQRKFFDGRSSSRVIVAARMPHVYPLFFPFLAESKAAMDEIRAFLKE